MDFTKFLAGLETEESTAFLLFTLGAFLLGTIIMWIGYGRIARKRKAEADKAKAELKAMQAEYGAFREQYELKEADLRKAELEVQSAQRMVAEYSAEREQLQKDLYIASEDIDKMQASLHAYANNIEDLNNQIIGLKARNQAYSSGKPVSDVSPSQLSQLQRTQNATLEKLSALESKLSQLNTENQALRTEINTVNEDAVSRADEATKNKSFNAKAAVIEADKIALAKEQVQGSLGKSIPLGSPGAADDLKQIEGIGAFLEQKLNDIGIYSYQQIAELDEEAIAQITNAIEFFPGRIQKDDWVGQARRLAGMSEQTVSTPAPEEPTPAPVEETPAEEPATPSASDDLKKIEGIGPKIEQILNFAGIHTWKALSETSAENLKEILANAGKRFKMHDPTTWPEQSRLAAAGNWDDLKKFQDYLNGGRDKG